MNKRDDEILAGDPLTNDEKERLHRIRRRKKAGMRVSEEDDFFYSITHERELAKFVEKVEEQKERFYELKARLKNKERIDREDYLFVVAMEKRLRMFQSRGGLAFRQAGYRISGGNFQP